MVTGGLGFIGSHLIAGMQKAGAECAVLARRGDLPEHRSVTVPILSADLCDLPSTVAALMEFRADLLIHLASSPDAAESHEQAINCLRNNVMGTLNLLEAMRSAGITQLVYGDSSKVFGEADRGYHGDMPTDPLSSYAISKLCGWEMCRLYRRLSGFKVVSLRATLVYGPGQPQNLIRFVIGEIQRGSPAVNLQGGSQTRDPLYIDDAITAYVAAAERLDELNGKVVAIGGGHEYAVLDIARKILDLMNSDAKLCVQNEAVRPTETRRSHCDNRYAIELLGWRPRVGLEEGLRRTITKQSWQSIGGCRAGTCSG